MFITPTQEPDVAFFIHKNKPGGFIAAFYSNHPFPSCSCQFALCDVHHWLRLFLCPKEIHRSPLRYTTWTLIRWMPMPWLWRLWERSFRTMTVIRCSLHLDLVLSSRLTGGCLMSFHWWVNSGIILDSFTWSWCGSLRRSFWSSYFSWDHLSHLACVDMHRCMFIDMNATTCAWQTWPRRNFHPFVV